jgi:hypothetical protein
MNSTQQDSSEQRSSRPGASFPDSIPRLTETFQLSELLRRLEDNLEPVIRAKRGRLKLPLLPADPAISGSPDDIVMKLIAALGYTLEMVRMPEIQIDITICDIWVEILVEESRFRIPIVAATDSVARTV